MYNDERDAQGKTAYSGTQLEAEVVALLSASVDPSLATAIAVEGGKPGYAGNDLYRLAIGGQFNPTNAETFLALIRRDIRPDLAERIATEATKPNYDSILLRDLAKNNLLNASTAIDVTSLGSNFGPLTFSVPQLQKKYLTHGVALGFIGAPNKGNLAAFQKSIETHVGNPNVVEFSGTYHSKPVQILLEPTTNLMVLAQLSRTFISIWYNSPAKQTFARYLGKI